MRDQLAADAEKVPQSLYDVLATVQIHSFRTNANRYRASTPVPQGGIEVWKRLRSILDEQGHRDWAVGLLAVAKTHAPKLVALLPVPISRAVLDHMRTKPTLEFSMSGQRITRHATVDTMLEAMNEHLKHDAKRNTLGLRTTMAAADIHVLWDYAPREPGQSKDKVYYMEDPDYAAALMQQWYGREFAPKLSMVLRNDL
uniref:DUF8205 domain-containing protein n=1 Tax=Mycena chlorophos TaxID=658473 RepID=A0ABQ0L8D2_MYCCL|nr:predicted protein [Mycena chlorophos]